MPQSPLSTRFHVLRIPDCSVSDWQTQTTISTHPLPKASQRLDQSRQLSAYHFILPVGGSLGLCRVVWESLLALPEPS